VDFVVPLLALILVGIMFVLFSRSQGGVGFLFLAAASGLMIYWIREIRIMARSEDQRMMAKETEQKDWVYDLIKNNDEMVFVAEIPGPEDQIKVRLTEGLLRIRGGQNFTRDVPLEMAQNMGISEYKYRNGVLTVRIRKL
jgi:HSP20 family molecular chaperone IbpA